MSGAAITPFLPALAALRIEVFRSWPYLYAGTEVYEANYLRTYSASPSSLFVLAQHAETGEVVGCSTGVALEHETANLQAPFAAAGIEVASVFYFGESVLLPAWRGRGLGHAFFDAREAYARSSGCFALTAFCAVDRAADDPRRPPGHLPLDRFWQSRGYTRQAQMQATMEWLEVGAQIPSSQTLTFWTRPL